MECSARTLRSEWISRALQGPWFSAVLFGTTSLTRCLAGSGSFAFPAPRSSLPVARLDLRGFPSIHRLLLATLRWLAGDRPSWASLSSRTGDIAVFPFHRPRSVIADRLSWDSSSGAGVSRSRRVPFHRLHPRRPPSRAASLAGCRRFGSERQARIAFRPRRFARPRRVSPPIAWAFTRLFAAVQGDEGLAGLLHPAADRRVRCVSSAWSGGVSPGGASIAGCVACCSRRLRFPASKFVPPGGFPPIAA
jgi:hypothetical protein